MNVILAKTDSGRALGEAFALARPRLPGTAEVADRRQQAFEAYQRLGLPHRRVEEWKYTDLRVLMREVLPLAAAPDPAAIARAGAALKLHAIDGVRKLVLIDGTFVPQLSDLAAGDIEIRSLHDVLQDAGDGAGADLLNNGEVNDPMLSLNAAMAGAGVIVTVPDGLDAKQPIHIVHIATRASAAVYTRSFLRLGKRSKAKLTESFITADGANGYQVNDAMVVWLAEEADLQHVRLMCDASDAANISTAMFTVGAKANLNSFSMTSGGGVSRYQGFIAIVGEGANVATNGVNLLNGRQHGDTTLFLDHAVPHCTSREIFRAVLDERAHSVFQGRINVRPNAQKTDAKMMTRALLLSDEAEADNKPELEIFADDVTCGHGATTGSLDESLLFYLRARGLSEKQAQALLIQAFVGEAIESIIDDSLRELAVEAASRWLAARS